MSSSSFTISRLAVSRRPTVPLHGNGEAKGAGSVPRGAPVSLVSICEIVLVRDCLNRCLVETGLASSVEGYGSLEEWRPGGDEGPTIVLLYCHREVASTIERAIPAILAKMAHALVVVISDQESPVLASRSIGLGARAFIGTIASLDLVLAALHLVRAGGNYMPVPITREIPVGIDDGRHMAAERLRLTPRQIEIVEYLNRGESNAVIARNLDIRKNTVKAHVRNIMRILGALNRLDVALKTAGFLTTSRPGTLD